jgi:hypothetical protein
MKFAPRPRSAGRHWPHGSSGRRRAAVRSLRVPVATFVDQLHRLRRDGATELLASTT